MTAASLLGLRGELVPSDRRNRTQARFGRSNLLRLIAIMATVALVGTGIATGLLYNTAFDAERLRLAEIVRSQVSLIEAVAKFDARFSESDHDQGASGATISQIQEAHRDYRSLRNSGQFHLARRSGGRLEYLLSHEQRGYGDAAMERALAGQAGTMVSRDRNGAEILAAYEPVPSLKLGMVAQISVREIRAPFIEAATVSGAVTLILIFLGALFVHRVNGSLIQRLHKSVTDLNTAQRIAKIGHWDWNIRTGELHWTDEIYRVFGQEPQASAASYDAFLEAIHPDDRTAVTEALGRAVKDGARYDIEHRIVQPDGQVRTVHEQGEVTRDRDAAPIHMTGTVHDITERKQAENLGQRIGRILDSSLNEIYVFDATTCRFVQVNEGAQRNLGYDMDALRAMTAWDIKPEIDEAKFREMVAPLCRGETEALRFESIHQRKNGSRYPVEIHLQLFADESPAVFVAIILDITIRKLAEDQVRMLNQDLEHRVAARTREFEDANDSLQETLAHLSQTQEQLVEAEKMASLGGLVAGVAHEINTPVGIGVTAASHLRSGIARLRQSYERDEMKRTDLERFLSTSAQSSDIILANLRRASELIRSFKQVAVDQSSDEVRRFNLRSYLDEIVTSLGPKIKRSGHTIDVTCPASIDIDGHPGALAQIVTNLVTNSLTHAYDEGQSGSLHISAHREDDRIHLVYRDDGKGISEEHLPHIFEPFFTTRRGQGGSGLGLNITYNLATQTLRGSIGCTSALGEGAEFQVSFPAELGERS